MEHHGEIPKQNVIAIIPARYASTRLPGKLLLDIAGEPLLIHTIRRAVAAVSVSRVLVATDDRRIAAVVSEYGFESIMTSPLHESGSDRIAEVAEKLLPNTIIVNVQGDEPTISPETIDRAVSALNADDSVDVATTFETIKEPGDVLNPNNVKVVLDAAGLALYFSRSPIPFPRDAVNRHGDIQTALKHDPNLCLQFKKHTGLYVYRKEFLLKFARMDQTPLELLEMLEQMRAVENGAKIRVVEAAADSIGVDTAEDLESVRDILITAANVQKKNG